MKNSIKFLALTLVVALIGFSFTSCGKDDDESYSNQALYSGDTYTIPDGSNVTWSSSNDLIASVSGTTVTAHCVGSATISSSKGSFKVTVGAKYNNVKLPPCMDFGTSMSSVEKKMSSYSLVDETSTALFYNASSPLKYYMYMFKNSALYSSCMLCTYSNFDAVANYVKERYYFVTYDSSSSYIGGFSPDKKTLIVISYAKMGSTYYYYFAFGDATESSNVKATRGSVQFEIPNDLLLEGSSLSSEQYEFIKEKLTK